MSPSFEEINFFQPHVFYCSAWVENTSWQWSRYALSQIVNILRQGSNFHIELMQWPLDLFRKPLSDAKKSFSGVLAVWPWWKTSLHCFYNTMNFNPSIQPMYAIINSAWVSILLKWILLFSLLLAFWVLKIIIGNLIEQIPEYD